MGTERPQKYISTTLIQTSSIWVHVNSAVVFLTKLFILYSQ